VTTKARETKAKRLKANEQPWQQQYYGVPNAIGQDQHEPAMLW